MGKELYDNIPRHVGELLNDVKTGRIGLPDLQRPFVWKDNKVRELLDSMLKGYPIGYVMLWSSPEDYNNAHTIGKNDKAFKRPNDLVIDGQQRLTSLLAAMTGLTVKDKDFKDRRVKISYNPLTAKFEVWSQAYERDHRWISDISEVFAADEAHNGSKFRKEVYNQINQGREKNGEAPLSEDEEEVIESNINALLNLKDYTIPTLQIFSRADEEDVADIFKRVNSGGQNLNENNFIETLLAVYDNEVHDTINEFCAKSRIPVDKTSYNQIIEVDPSHLIRMAVGVGFHRARLRYAYMILRGKDLESGLVTEEKREEKLAEFKSALSIVTDLNNWHAFLNLFGEAGYLKSNLVASNYVVIYSYILYLIGKYEYKVNPVELRRAMTRWIFMATVSMYYSKSTETFVEKQFADLRNVKSAEEFLSYINKCISSIFTEDFFNVELPNNFNSSAAISPAWFGYIASLNVLGTPMLFSNTPLSKYWIAGVNGEKQSIDKHHIFPKNYLTNIGVETDRERNQIANFTYLDYNTNIDISDDAPSLYVERYKEKLGEEGYKQACEQNALPEGFESLDYFDFLAKRRLLMAQIVKKAYKKLCE